MGFLMLDFSRMPRSKSVWSGWIKYVLDGGCDVTRAALVNPSMTYTVAASKHFHIQDKEIQDIKKAFEDPAVDRLCLSGVTFMLRPRSLEGPPCLVAFAGKKYLVISASLTMYVVLMLDCVTREDRQRIDKAVLLAKRVSASLSKKKY